MVLLHLSEEGVGIELLMVEHKHRRTGKPLAIELTPYSLAPAGIGNCEMERTLVEVMPEDTC